MKMVGVLELRQNLAGFLTQVADGEEIVVLHRNRPIARLLPYKEEQVNIAFLEGSEYEEAMKDRARRL